MAEDFCARTGVHGLSKVDFNCVLFEIIHEYIGRMLFMRPNGNRLVLFRDTDSKRNVEKDPAWPRLSGT